MPSPREPENDQERLLDAEAGTQSNLSAELEEARTFSFGTEKPVDSAVSSFTLTPDAWAKVALWALLVLVLLGLGLVAAFVFLDVDYITPDYEIKFLVVGDWGRLGNSNQTAVADVMAQVARKMEPDFIISTGDNFYESGLTSVQDVQFDQSFSRVYSDRSLQVQWHAILGNHDYGETWPFNETSGPPPECSADDSGCYYSPLHQLDIRLVERDWRWHCERFYSLPLARSMFTTTQVEIFFIDTNPALPEYHEARWAERPGGIAEQSWPSQVRELEYRLSRSKARWKIVVGHHPVRNNRMPPIPTLMQDLEPLLRKYGVRAYFSGHEHCLQHLHVPGEPTHYFVSGGGSLTDYPIMLADYGGSQWQHQGSGFAAVVLEDDEIEVKFYGIDSDRQIYKNETESSAKGAGLATQSSVIGILAFVRAGFAAARGQHQEQTHLEGASTSLQPMDAEALESGDLGSAHGLSRPSPMLTRRGDKAGQAPSPSAAAADGGPSPTSDDQHENGQEYEVAQGGDTQQGEGTAEEGNASGQAALKLKPDAFGADLDGGLDSQEDWAIEWPSLNMSAIGGKDIGGSESDFEALFSMVDGRVEDGVLHLMRSLGKDRCGFAIWTCPLCPNGPSFRTYQRPSLLHQHLESCHGPQLKHYPTCANSPP
ncbi:hypothetical protein WJX84_003264 [Apatococcus fuscideae]|uniref:Calcineurin-like phosphoesterase domain-containing protein n=1 Tax=Apatococcus fuscideae TaxID=2026836 RepID=A0AAW1T2A7_9CHLO